MDKKTDPEKEGLFITTRHATAYAAVALAVVSSFFIAGYFFGKNQAIDQFVAQVEPNAFTDQLAESLAALCDQDQKITDATPLDENRDSLVRKEKGVDSTSANLSLKKDRFYAQLIGYGTHKAATRFSEKLQKQGMPVVVKTRMSSTAQGKKRTWYQVVTKPFDDRNALEELTHRIATHEKVQGIKILSCT